jgi:hypothetical protein
MRNLTITLFAIFTFILTVLGAVLTTWALNTGTTLIAAPQADGPSN